MKSAMNYTTCLYLVAFSTFGNMALAQMNNKPFSFNTSGGNPGMSSGGKQAILNNEILGITPNNLLRAKDGSLLSVVKGKSGVTIVSIKGGDVIPSFRGSSFRGDNASWSIDVLNSFFMPRDSDGNSFIYSQIHTGAVISTWTGRIASNLPVSYTPSSSVDSWTGMVMSTSD